MNQHFETRTGYRIDEVLGKNCRFLQGKDTSKSDLLAISSAVREASKLTVTLKNYRKDGTAFWNRLIINPIFSADRSRVDFFLGIQHDVTNEQLTINAQEKLIYELGMQLKRSQLKAG